MRALWQPATLSLALLAAFPLTAAAQSIDELRKELRALKEQVNALEQKLKAVDAKASEKTAEKSAEKTSDKTSEKAPEKQWGMTPEQTQEFNRIAIKTEALEDNQDAMGFRGLKISGQMDPAFIYNKNQDRAGFQFLNRVSDDGFNYDNSYFGMALIDFQKEMEGGSKWRLTLAPNRGVGAVFDGDSVIHEATVSLPLSNLQTRLIAGQIPDWSGYEYLQPTLNKLITHNLLFDFTLPTAYTGAGLELTRGKWISKVVLANTNASKRQAGEKTPVIAYRVDYAKGEFQGFGFAGVNGKAANLRASVGDALNPVSAAPYDTHDTRLDLFEADAYFIRGDWTLQGQLSYGHQKQAAVSADPLTGELRNAQWWGLSTLAGYKFTPRFEGIARFDYLANKKNGGGLLGYVEADPRNGIGPGGLQDDPETGANRYALSVGLGYLYSLSTTFKAEYRLDRANQAVFEDVKDGSFKKSNHLLGASMVVSF